jgi:hypothetical protein
MEFDCFRRQKEKIGVFCCTGYAPLVNVLFVLASDQIYIDMCFCQGKIREPLCYGM